MVKVIYTTLHHQQEGTAHQQVGVVQVLLPEGSDLPLASDVPDVQLHTVRGYALNVEALCVGREQNALSVQERIQKEHTPLR